MVKVLSIIDKLESLLQSLVGASRISLQQNARIRVVGINNLSAFYPRIHIFVRKTGKVT